MITTIRGKGLLNAIVIDEDKTQGHSAWDLCMLMKEKGLLVGRALKIAHVNQDEETAGTGSTDQQGANASPQAKPTHKNIIRLAPPLVISEEEIKSALRIIEEAVTELPGLKGKREKEVIPNESEKNVHIGLEN